MITQSELKELIHYNPETGLCTWIKSNGPRAKIGGTIGCKNYYGYLMTRINGINYYVHRLIWVYMTGSSPNKEIIDHIDGNSGNNRWSNLREATRQENYRNVPARNKLKIKGVSKIRNRFYATITINRTSIALGKFDTLEEAAEAYKQAANKYHGEFVHSSVKI